jgi:nucleoside-diphosphate-sugar epimerase
MGCSSKDRHTKGLPVVDLTAWRDARVLVTGARGFIGGHLCRRLLDAGAQVHGVSGAKSTSPLDGLGWSRTDLSNQRDVNALVERVQPDVLFHLAGHVTGSQQLEHVSPALESNLTSTVRILTAVAETGQIRVVLAGSMQEPDPADPTAVPCSPYAASKWACTGYARMFHSLYRVSVIIARPFMVYGPGQWDLAKLLPYVIVSFLKGEAPRISSGARELDWVYIDDVVDGLLVVARSGYDDARMIDLGTGALVSIRTTVKQVRDLLGSSIDAEFGAVADRPFERPSAARLDETTRLTGWTPKTSLHDGLNETIAWYRSYVSTATALH